MKRLLLLLPLCAATLSGCWDPHMDGGILVVNESPETIVFEGGTLDPGGGKTLYYVTECTDINPLSFSTQAGVEYARLESEYCPDQTWTITGPGEVSLTDD